MPGQLATTETAIMQRAGDQRPRRTATGYRGQIAGVADTTGSEYLPPRRPLDQGCEPAEVGPEAGPDTRQRHGDDPLRPAGGVGKQRRRAGELVAAKIERQNHRLGGPQIPDQFIVGERLAADDGSAETTSQPGGQRGPIADPGIHPERQPVEAPAQRFDHPQTVALTQDRIEVGDVKIGERIEIEERGDDVRRRAAAAQRRFDRPVTGALAPDGADDLAAHQIDHGDQFQRQDRATLRVFIYEHITGGGLIDEPLPPSLAHEGDLMLLALVDDLTKLPGIEVVVTRDPRLAAVRGPAHSVFVRPGERLESILRLGIGMADVVWPIAPESGGVLERVSGFVAAQEIPLLGSSAAAVRLTASKFDTAEILAAAGIAVVPTYRHPALLPPDADSIVIKPDDGAGCLDTRLHTRASAHRWWAAHEHGKHVLQPFVAGEARSLSLLCAAGEATVLTCNRQHVLVVDGVFAFAGVSVNARPAERARYATLASRIARALPGLWGYVGVDLIETATGPVVIEVNPRLTTSYAGLARALGINPAALVLALRQSRPGQCVELPTGSAVVIETHHAQ